MIPGSWQLVLCVTLLAFLAVGCVFVRPKRRGASRVKRPHHVVDYSHARAKAIEWLGDDYLLAKPINRPRQTELPALLKRQAS